MSEQEIRKDWYLALENERVYDISAKIEWGFFPQDLLILCDLHEAGYFRDKIADLLTDCNFHTECRLIKNRQYADCRNLIMQDIEIVPQF